MTDGDSVRDSPGEALTSGLSSMDAPSELAEHVEEMPILTSTPQLEDKPAKDVVTQVGER